MKHYTTTDNLKEPTKSRRLLTPKTPRTTATSNVNASSSFHSNVKSFNVEDTNKFLPHTHEFANGLGSMKSYLVK